MEHIHPPIRSICKQASRAVTYGRNLRNKDEAYMEVKAGVSALLGFNENGCLQRNISLLSLNIAKEETKKFTFVPVKKKIVCI